MILRIGNNPALNRGGFTLIEVLLAVTLLALGSVSILRAYGTSTDAMERAQYDLDASLLLHTAMADFEETTLTQGDPVPGISSGAFPASGGKIEAAWAWRRQFQKLDIHPRKAKQLSASGEAGSVKEKEPDFDLNKLTLTVLNPGRIPVREVSLETFVRTESVKSS